MSYHYGANVGFTGFASMSYGMMGVEFFFVLTGILAAASASRYLQQNTVQNDVGEQTRAFLIRKILRIYPYVAIAILLSICIYLWDFGIDQYLDGHFLNQIPNYLFLMNGGFDVFSQLEIGLLWYLSVSIIGLLILYPIYVWKKSIANWIIMPLIFIFTIGYMSSTLGSTAWPNHWLGIINAGLLRGLGEMSLGFFIFGVVEYLNNIKFKTIGSISITILRLSLLIFIIYYCLGEYVSVRTTSFLLIMGLLLLLEYSSAGFHLPVNINICMFLGSISLPIYLFHGLIRDIMVRFYGFDWYLSNYVIVMVTTVIVSIISVVVINLLKRYNVLEKISSIFIERNSA